MDVFASLDIVVSITFLLCKWMQSYHTISVHNCWCRVVCNFRSRRRTIFVPRLTKWGRGTIEFAIVRPSVRPSVRSHQITRKVLPFHILHWSFWDTLRIPTDQVALARHSGVQVPVISRHGITWSFLPIKIGTFQFLPTGLHELCFGFCFAGPLPRRSLLHGPLLRVHFGESLVLDYTQKSTISTLAVKLSVSATIYPRWTATWWMGWIPRSPCTVHPTK